MNTSISISRLRREAGAVLRRLSETDAVVITRYGRPTAVLLDFARYEEQRAQLEDLIDLASLGEAANEPARPYEQFLAELVG